MKYNQGGMYHAPPPNKELHPIWRGIGCLLILVVPVVAYLLADLTIRGAIAQGWPMPYQLMGYPVMPVFLWNVTPGLAPILTFIQGQNNLYAVLSLTIVYIVLLSSLISIVYSIIYRLVGPPRYGPTDVPPPPIYVKPYKR